MSDIFKVLSVRLRLRILNLLLKRPLCVSDLQQALDQVQPVISKRLAELLELGLVEKFAEGNRRRYAVITETALHRALWSLVRAWAEQDPELQCDVESLS